MKNKHIKLFEEFDRPEELDGFRLVGKMTTEEFMNKLKTRSLMRKNYVYRLMEYIPNSELSWDVSGSIAMPIRKDKKAVAVNGNNMYLSPFIAYPKPYERELKTCYFYLDEDGNYSRYKGTSEKRKLQMIEKAIDVFCGISFSAFIGNRSSEAISDTDFIKLSNLVEDIFDNEKRHSSWISSTRNYLGYNFSGVLVYEITNPTDAVDTIIYECENTVYVK